MIPTNPVLIHSLVHLAWCDGLLTAEEITFLRDLFRELGIDQGSLETLLSQDCPLPKEQELLIACPDSGARRTFLALAVRLAWSDGELSDPEWEVIKGFCRTFGLKMHTWKDLNQWLGPL